MPLKSGKGSFSYNVSELMHKPKSKAREKAINTLARKRGISKKEAQRKQAIAIAVERERK